MERDRPTIGERGPGTTGPGQVRTPGRRVGAAEPDATLHSAYRKTSFVSAVTVDGFGEGVEQGWEHGSVGPPDPDRPSTVPRLSPPVATDRLAEHAGPSGELDPDIELARRLRQALAEALAPGGDGARPIETSVSRARVTELVETRRGPFRQDREVRAAQVSVGGRPGRPRWSRIVPLAVSGSDLPVAWVPAIVEEVAGWCLPGTAQAPDLAARPFAAGPFAVADILRVAATAWLRGGRVPGERVAARGVDLVDPGFRFPARGGDRDAAGAPVHPTVIVQGGRLVRLPAAGGAGGFLVRDSWRRPPRTDWRSLSLKVAADLRPVDLPVVTRVQFVGRRVFASGWLPRDGTPHSRFGPVPAPPASAWLLRARHAAGPDIEDATGVPVRVPPIVFGPA